jgi:hypothetical protein
MNIYSYSLLIRVFTDLGIGGGSASQPLRGLVVLQVLVQLIN